MARDHKPSNEAIIQLDLSVEEAALVWECVDWCRIKPNPERNEQVVLSLLNKIESQLGLSKTKCSRVPKQAGDGQDQDQPHF